MQESVVGDIEGPQEAENEGVMSWIGSAFSRYGTGWFSVSERDFEDDMNTTEEPEELEDEEEDIPVNIELTEEERKKLIKLQLELSQEVATLESSTMKGQEHLSRHVQVYVSSVKIHLTQHVEYPDNITKRYIIVPRPLIRVVFNQITLKQFLLNQCTKLHLSVVQLVVEDLWSESTLFSELIRSPVSYISTSKDKSVKVPSIHANFSTDPLRGIQPSLNIQLEPIQVMYPIDVIQRIVQFFQTALPDKEALKRYSSSTSTEVARTDPADDNTILLNDISNMPIYEPISMPPSTISIPTKITSTASHMGLNVSIQCKSITIATCANFVKKETEILVLSIPSIHWQRTKQYNPKVSSESLHKGAISQISVYTTTMPSFVCNSTADRCYITQPFDVDISYKIGRLMEETVIAPTPWSNDIDFMDSYSMYNQLECTVTPIVVTISSSPLVLILEIVNNARSLSNYVPYPTSSSKPSSKPKIKCITWKPLYGLKKEQPSSDLQQSNVFKSVTITCNEISFIVLPPDADNVVQCPILMEGLVDGCNIEVLSYLLANNTHTTSINANVCSFRVVDENNISFLVAESTHSTSYYPSTGAPASSSFGTPLFTSFPTPQKSVALSPTTPLTPLRSTKPSFDLSFDSPGLSPEYMEFSDITDDEESIDVPNTSLQTPHLIRSFELPYSKRKKQNSAISISVSISKECFQVDACIVKLDVAYLDEVVRGILKFQKLLSPVYSSSSKLSQLSKEQIQWQQLYLLAKENMKSKFIEDSVTNGVESIMFECWKSWVANCNIYKPAYTHWITLSTFQSYFNMSKLKFTLDINCIVITIANLDSHLDIVIPSSSLSSTFSDTQGIFSSRKMDMTIPQIQLVLAESLMGDNFSETANSSFLSSDSDDESDLDKPNTWNSDTKQIQVLTVTNVEMQNIIQSDPSQPKISSTISIDDIRLDIAGITLCQIISILHPLTVNYPSSTPLEFKGVLRSRNLMKFDVMCHKSTV